MQPNRTCPYTPFHRYNTVYNTHLIQELQGLPWSWNCLKIGLVSSRGWLCKAYLACCTVLSKGDSWTEEGGRGGVLYHLPHGSHMAGCFLCITCYLMAAFYVSPVTSWLLLHITYCLMAAFHHMPASWLLCITWQLRPASLDVTDVMIQLWLEFDFKLKSDTTAPDMGYNIWAVQLPHLTSLASWLNLWLDFDFTIKQYSTSKSWSRIGHQSSRYGLELGIRAPDMG